VIGPPGVVPEARHLSDPVFTFDYYLSVAMQEKILSFTNKRIPDTWKQQAISENADASDEEEEGEIKDDRGIWTWVNVGDQEDESDNEDEEVKRVYVGLEIADDYVITEDDKYAESGRQKFKKFVTIEEFRVSPSEKKLALAHQPISRDQGNSRYEFC
jgi:hypothetical protein